MEVLRFFRKNQKPQTELQASTLTSWRALYSHSVEETTYSANLEGACGGSASWVEKSFSVDCRDFLSGDVDCKHWVGVHVVALKCQGLVEEALSQRWETRVLLATS